MKATRLLLTITYNNGKELKQLVNYLHGDGEKIYFTVDKQVNNSVVGDVVSIPLGNIKKYDLEHIECDGWNY